MATDFKNPSHADTTSNRTANFEIMSWHDPVMDGTPVDEGLIVIDGLVPLNVALEINALCSASRAYFDVIGIDDLEFVDIARGTGRVLIDGLVPLAIAQKAKAICDTHNASL